jgi:hypothetical protein
MESTINEQVNKLTLTDFSTLCAYEINFFIKLKIVEKINDKTKYIDIRKYWNGKPTKKGILLSFDDFEKIKTLNLNSFK